MVDAPARTRPRIVATMGTVIGLDVRDGALPETAFEAAIAWLTDVDLRFSPFRPGSEISRLARGEVAPEDCSPDVRYVLTRCETLRADTKGYFDIRGPGLRGGLDPSGYVKGWAVEEAAHILEAAGARNYVLNAGGDVVLRGAPDDGRPWIVGIRHPLESDLVAARLAIEPGPGRQAVATSGLYERPGHIVNPRNGEIPGELLSMTVVGPSLAIADAYATAAFAMGRDGLRWLASRPGYAGYAIDRELRPSWNAAFDPYLVPAARSAG